MKRTQTLLEHFADWQQEHFSNETFYQDGIINEDEYDKTTPKILFIAKEPNATNHKGEGPVRSFCDEWNNDKPDYGFALRIAEWAFGILNTFPVFTDIDDSIRYAYLKKIAFMNLKKSGGNGRLNKKNEFNQLVKTQVNYIRQQIEMVHPDIILLCISHSEYLKELLFPETKGNWINCGYYVDVSKASNKKLIDFYHPSSRNVPAAAYSLLQNVVQSKIFKNL